MNDGKRKISEKGTLAMKKGGGDRARVRKKVYVRLP
jgi:hypothetical protein